ncbi:DUF6476 family protein [Plastoroseomonas hellenica]
MRGLKILVAVMGVLIVAGTVGLAVALVQKLGGGNAAPGGALALRQPEGTAIQGVSAGDGVVAVWVRRPDGERVLLVDPRRGTVTREIRLGE